jgi:distribution and morphology protein 34
MHARRSELPRHSRPGVLAADQPLVVPMILRISDLKLRGIVVLVVSKTKGVTLVFKNDPLESIRVSSTFDSVSILRDFLQRQIEAQLRNMLQEDLPVMIHNLSLRFIQSAEDKKRKEEQTQRQNRLSSVDSKSDFIRRTQSYQGSLPGTPLSMPIRPRSYTCGSHMLSDSLSYPSTPCSLSGSNSSIATPTIDSFDVDQSTYVDPYLDDFTMSQSPLGLYGSFVDNDMEKTSRFDTLNRSFESLNINPEYINNNCRPVPITVANLFTHNRQQSMNPLGIYSMYRDYTSIPSISSQQDDTQSEENLSMVSTPCLSMADIYGDDADAPWYATEGPELFSSITPLPSKQMPFDGKDIVLRPSENAMAAKLSQLTNVNYTLSPLTENVRYFTFRSLPHVGKAALNTPRNKKVPKRRIIKLNIAAPNL